MTSPTPSITFMYSVVVYGAFYRGFIVILWLRFILIIASVWIYGADMLDCSTQRLASTQLTGIIELVLYSSWLGRDAVPWSRTGIDWLKPLLVPSEVGVIPEPVLLCPRDVLYRGGGPNQASKQRLIRHALSCLSRQCLVFLTSETGSHHRAWHDGPPEKWTG